MPVGHRLGQVSVGPGTAYGISHGPHDPLHVSFEDGFEQARAWAGEFQDDQQAARPEGAADLGEAERGVGEIADAPSNGAGIEAAVTKGESEGIALEEDDGAIPSLGEGTAEHAFGKVEGDDTPALGYRSEGQVARSAAEVQNAASGGDEGCGAATPAQVRAEAEQAVEKVVGGRNTVKHGLDGGGAFVGHDPNKPTLFGPLLKWAEAMLAAILSRRRALYSTRRLREELLRLGCEVRVVDPLKCVVRLSERLQTVLYHRRDLSDVDTVIPRVGMYAVPFILAVVRQFANMGIPVLNSPEAIACARDKLRCLQTLARAGLPTPGTLATRYPASFENLMALVGGPPVVLKLSSGSQGTGVILSESVESARSSLEAIWSLGADLLIQKFISESRGRDLRVLVIDGEVRAAMRRVAGPNEFRSNIHRGGAGEPATVSASYRDAAIRAAAAVGLTVAGVDILETRTGPLVIEVNASPGFQGLEKATGLNVAGMIAEQAVAMARRPRRVRA